MLASKGTRFLTGDTMCCFDCELMPKLQHIRVAGEVKTNQWDGGGSQHNLAARAGSCHLSCWLPSPPPTTHHCLKQDIKYSIQELSSAISRSRRVWWTCGPTSGRCTSSMPSSSPIPLIRWCSGAVYSNRNLCFFHRTSSTSTRISLEWKLSNMKSWPLPDTQLLSPQRSRLEILHWTVLLIIMIVRLFSVQCFCNVVSNNE